MKEIIKKIDSFGVESYFTIIGSNEDEIDDAVYELMKWSRRDYTYRSESYDVVEYNVK